MERCVLFRLGGRSVMTLMDRIRDTEAREMDRAPFCFPYEPAAERCSVCRDWLSWIEGRWRPLLITRRLLSVEGSVLFLSVNFVSAFLCRIGIVSASKLFVRSLFFMPISRICWSCGCRRCDSNGQFSPVVWS
jgi:hypothetical protein